MKIRSVFAGLVLILALVAVAQAQPEIGLSAFAVTNNQPGTQEFGYGLHGQFKYDRIVVGGDFFGDPARNNPKRLSQGRAFATFQAYEWGNLLKFHVGAGGFKQGNETGAFGQLNVDAGKKFTAFGRAGRQNFYEADGVYFVVDAERFRVGPFYRYSTIRINGLKQDNHQAGFRLTLR